MTVQAINSVVYGGALVTTVCHSNPLIVDTSPPILHVVDGVFYDEYFDLMGIYYDGIWFYFFKKYTRIIVLFSMC